MIKTENARPNGWVFVDIDGRDLGSYVEEAKQAVADQLDMPAGYSIAWSGQYDTWSVRKSVWVLLCQSRLPSSCYYFTSASDA
ncbi:cobalt-zinc-cadmium resistance protein CzcA [Vibrio sp. JCM 19053]|nr:cobalt-zinc-cadmium resistance protein CzcA [Vibrio sp. JCM 19053]